MKIFDTQIVKDYMKNNKLTVKQFCEKCNISYYSYRQFMTDDLKITVPKVFRMSKFIGVHLCYMFNKKECQ